MQATRVFVSSLTLWTWLYFFDSKCGAFVCMGSDVVCSFLSFSDLLCPLVVALSLILGTINGVLLPEGSRPELPLPSPPLPVAVLRGC